VTGPVDFLFAAAQRRRGAGDQSGAVVLLDELLCHQPDHVPALRMVAELQIVSNPVASANAARRIVQKHPGDLEATEMLGRSLSAIGRHDESLRAFQIIVAAKPSNVFAHTNLSVSLLRAGDPHAAIAAAERAIVLDRNVAEAHAALGHAYNLLHQSQQAIDEFHRALDLRPNYPDALLGAARAYRHLGRLSTAILALLRAADMAPNSTSPQIDLATYFREFGVADAARDTLYRAIAMVSNVSPFYSNLFLDMQYDPDIDEVQASAAARQWGLRQIAAVRPISRSSDRDRNPDRPLRVGYVSADLYRHPVGWLGSAPIMVHDRSAVTPFIYANQTSYDPLTLALQRSVDSWIPIMGLDDDSVATRIAADQIDILVDLAGHTAGNRLGVFARRSAPVQLTWLGYSATTGLPAMDYMLLDRHHLCDGAESHILESLVCLPDIRFCYAAPDYAGDVAQPPSANGSPTTFASFNNSAKLNDAVIALWARVLSAVRRSRLLLKWRSCADPLLQDRIRSMFARHDIDPERIQFDGASPHADMLRQYGEVDIALDPFPFGGGLTSCEALWMGVPVVTLAGLRPFSRQTHAILHAIGKPEWSACNSDDYVAIAARLANDPIKLSRARRSLRQQMAASALCDGPRFARNLERVYRKLWLKYLDDH
jgi:protein O-GlcNAc transferase